jgi:CDP-4-dehydro-6-deoxyglucose reductase, E1
MSSTATKVTIQYPLASTTWDQAELDALSKVIASGHFTMGKYVAEFESAFARYVGSKYCVMVNSGSSANLLLIAALRYVKNSPLKPGDEVIVPAVSWATTYFPLHQYQLKTKFVDISLETLNFDLNALEAAITDKTRAILAVNLLGNPNDFARIQKIIAGRDIMLLEDNCESLGAVYQSKHAGTFGRAGTYSSFFSHHISTMEGGMVVTDDEELYHVMISLRAHGWTRQLPANNLVCEKSDNDSFFESFRFVLPGYNLRPLELSGAVGLEQLKKLPGMISERRKNADIFRKKFASNPSLIVQHEVGESSWFGFSFVLTDKAKNGRAKVVQHLANNGIECRPIVAGNFARNEAVQYMEHEIHDELRNADRVHSSGFFVGNHHYNLSKQLDLLSDVLAEVL